ncbi:MAG TPA: CotH kinase family protein, partial [Polyangiaceae bacterium]|nr:CotH kinase family protein [Polyangiaceae bacterium]
STTSKNSSPKSTSSSPSNGGSANGGDGGGDSDPEQGANSGGVGGTKASTAKSGNVSKGGAAVAAGGNATKSSGTAGKGGSTTKTGDTAGKGGSTSKTSGTVGGSAATSDAVDPLIGDVKFSTPSQSFKDQIEVGMSTDVAGAEIRYTVDGKLPTASSTLYGGDAVTLKSTTQVRAQAFVGGQASGSVSTGIYIARTIDPTSDIPIMVVESYGKAKPCDKETYVETAVMVWEPVDGVAKMASLPTLVTRAGYHARGQSSMAFAQTPYKIEFWDNAGKDVDLPLLGMPADSDWALISPYYDRTLIRNPFVYTLGKEMGMEAPRTEYAEVYINQTTHSISSTEYEGIYWVSELIKNNKVRTNLKQLKADDTDSAKLSGGYIFKFDQAAAEEPKILCTGSNPVAGFGSGAMGGGAWGGGMGGGTTTKATPATTKACTTSFAGGGASTGSGAAGTCWTDLEVVDPDDLNDQQKAWLTDYIQKFHDSLHQNPIGDYGAYIDLQSFIDYLLISELTRNVDAYVRSAYFFKDRDGKLKAGPLWDYNFALGGVGAQSATPTSTSDPGWQYTGTSRNVNNWYPKLTSDSKFMAQVKTRYTELRKTLWSDSSMNQRMDTLSAPLKQAVVRDYAKWPVTGVILSSTGFVGGPTTPTWDGQLKVMRDFVAARLAWMDANIK